MQSSVYLFRIHARKQINRYEVFHSIFVIYFLLYSYSKWFLLARRYYYFLYSLSTKYRRLTEIKITSRMAYLPPQHFLNMKKVFGKQPYTSVLVTSNISKYYDYNRTFSYFASMKSTATPRDSLSLRKCLTCTGRRKRQSRTLNSQRNQKKITTSINRQYWMSQLKL